MSADEILEVSFEEEVREPPYFSSLPRRTFSMKRFTPSPKKSPLRASLRSLLPKTIKPTVLGAAKVAASILILSLSIGWLLKSSPSCLWLFESESIGRNNEVAVIQDNNEENRDPLYVARIEQLEADIQRLEQHATFASTELDPSAIERLSQIEKSMSDVRELRSEMVELKRQMNKEMYDLRRMSESQRKLIERQNNELQELRAQASAEYANVSRLIRGLPARETAGLRNLASHLYGARIVSSATTPSMNKQMLSFTKDNSANNVIMDRWSRDPGACLPVAAGPANVTIALAFPGTIQHFEYIHTFWREEDGIPETTPKRMRFVGCTDDFAMEDCEVLCECVIGEADAHRDYSPYEMFGVATFCPVQESSKVFASVRVELLENYGADITCIYQVRVMGKASRRLLKQADEDEL